MKKIFGRRGKGNTINAAMKARLALGRLYQNADYYSEDIVESWGGRKKCRSLSGELLRKAAAVDPENPNVWIALGHHNLLHDKQKALASYQKAYALDPENGEA